MKLNLKCPINSLGYGVTGINVLRSLLQRGIEVAHFPIGPNQPETYDDFVFVNRGEHNKKTFGHYAPCLKIWHQFDMAEWAGKNKLYGMPIFELDTFAEHEVHHLSFCDELIATSQWGKEVIRKHFPDKPLSVAPLGVNRLIFNEANCKPTQKCIFFNCGKWEIRKGHDFIGEVFLETFSDTESVELWMMCDNPFFTKDETEEWELLYNHPKIRLIHRVQNQNQLAEVMKQTTCGVFPSRAEGWNLELLEMMSCGKHVIATDYSGHTEFCNDDNCLLIATEDVEPAFDGKWFNGTGNWASVDEKQKDSFSLQMLKVYQNWEDHKENMTNHFGIETAKVFTWDNTACKLLDIITEE